MFLVFLRVWDKGKILSPHEESSPRPSDSVLWCYTTEPQRLHGEQGSSRSSYDTRPAHCWGDAVYIADPNVWFDCSIHPHRLFGVFRARLLPVSRHRSQNRESEHKTGKFDVGWFKIKFTNQLCKVVVFSSSNVVHNFFFVLSVLGPYKAHCHREH